MSSPSMGSSIGVGLGAWETASVQRTSRSDPVRSTSANTHGAPPLWSRAIQRSSHQIPAHRNKTQVKAHVDTHLPARDVTASLFQGQAVAARRLRTKPYNSFPAQRIEVPYPGHKNADPTPLPFTLHPLSPKQLATSSASVS